LIICIPPRDTPPNQDSASTVTSGTPPPAAFTATDTGKTVPQRANPTRMASAHYCCKYCRLWTESPLDFAINDDDSRRVRANSSDGVNTEICDSDVKRTYYEIKNIYARVDPSEIELQALDRVSFRLCD